MTATPECKHGAYCTHRDKKEFGGSDQNCFDHHAFYFRYDHNATTVFYSGITPVKGSGDLLPDKIFKIAFPTMPLCKHYLISIRRRQSILIN